MHHRDQEAYRHFVSFMLDIGTDDHLHALQHVMKAMGGAANPDLINDWWWQWRIMREEQHKRRHQDNDE